MPVDLNKDIRRLSETKWAPGLGEAYALALGITKAAQLCDRNKLKLQSLAHSMAVHIISIAKCMQGKSSRGSSVAAKLQDFINELKRILQEVSNAIQKYSKDFPLSLEASHRLAAERDKDITRLEERLQEVQSSIFSLHGYSETPPEKNINYHIGLIVHRPQTVANSQYRSGLAIKRSETTAAPQFSESTTRQVLHWELKGPHFSRFGLEQDLPRSPNVYPEVLSEHSFDLSDNLSRVETNRTGSPIGGDRPPSRTFLSRLKRRSAPNLTANIKGIQYTHFAGGFGDIYWGFLQNSKGSERVALKLLRVVNQKSRIEKAKKNFRREVNIWCLLRHPNVLPFYGTCESSDEIRLFMVSPWAENGRSLEYLQRNPDASRGVLLHETSSALKYLHSGKDVPPIIHGDVKADNVLISRTGHALLCDFGLSRYAEGWISSGSSSNAHGTARFMAPELLIGGESIPASSNPTKESDVFAFGSLMLQLYTGKLPFSDLPDAPALVKIANKEVPSRPSEPVVFRRGLNDHIWALMNDCWNPIPSHRPSMEDVTWKLIWATAR